MSEFLHGLGIDSEFIEKATQLCEDKELSEYQAWLKQFSDFVR